MRESPTINGNRSRTAWPRCRATVSTVTLMPPTIRSSPTKPTRPQPARRSATSSSPYAPPSRSPNPGHRGRRRGKPHRPAAPPPSPCVTSKPTGHDRPAIELSRPDVKDHLHRSDNHLLLQGRSRVFVLRG